MNVGRLLSRANMNRGIANMDADWIRSVQGYWDFNTDAEDQSGNNMHGTLVNAPTYAASLLDGRQAIELDGDDAYVSLGDLTYLNAVSAFTIAFWMNQDVLDQDDGIFRKRADGTHLLIVGTVIAGGILQCRIFNGTNASGQFDYSSVMSASSWHHVAWVFDGSGAANIDRLKAYVDGQPVVLGFTGTIPATTPDMPGQNALIGYIANSFDGKLFDFIICNAALSAKQVGSLHWLGLHGEL